MSNALTTSPKSVSGTSSPGPRARGASGGDRDGLLHPRQPNGNRAGSSFGGASGTTIVNSTLNGPGSFSTSLRSTNTIVAMTPNAFVEEISNPPSPMSSERLVEELTDQLNKAIKYKEGAENLLQVLDTKKPKEAKQARNQAEKEYNARNQEISQLMNRIEAIKKPREVPGLTRAANKFKGEPIRPASANNGLAISGAPEWDPGSESPTLSLTELLRDLEELDKRPEYYVEKANILVALFKRHPNLKYELAWNTFGNRVQNMLLNENKEVVAAGYRIARYAMTDLQSLKTIRTLYTDEITIISLVKESRANVEREQALKFVRAFIEVPGGVQEISRGVVRAIVACAEQVDDRLRGVSMETLAEILILNPSLVVSAGGVRVLTQVLSEGPYELSDTISLAFLYLLDLPVNRKYIRPGNDLEVVFSVFTDSYSEKSPPPEEKLRSSAKVISCMLKSWPGLLALSMYDLRAPKSLVSALAIPSSSVRDIVLELFFDIFRIKPPSWSSSFLAGRRLTTYGRVTNLKSESDTPKSPKTDDAYQGNLVEHFTALLLAVFFEADLLKSLMALVEDNSDPAIVRKTTLLLGEILKLASRLLPSTYSARLQLLPDLFISAANFRVPTRFAASAAVYQIDSLNRTLHRSLAAAQVPQRTSIDDEKRGQRQVEQAKLKIYMAIDDRHFSGLIVDSGVLNAKSHTKWNWDALNEMIQGPLLNPKRLDEAIKGTKFMKRLMSFYRPFKYKFSDVKNTKPNQRYVRTGCALFHTLLQTPEGVRYLSENKILRQIAECLAQLDRMSGITSPEPLFSTSRLIGTLSCGYFAMLGVLSSDPKGLAMMERWRMFNMFYHISDSPDRPDLLELFVSNMDFTLEGHPRIILSKALTMGPKSVRLFATSHLRGLISTAQSAQTPIDSKTNETAEWAIRLLITQLYDPDVEVCETAVKILEEACNITHSLEYVVKCRPALDHLGEIGAPLLLRFLSTSVGYHYLNELDYINREMDDWFHGRNDSYVLTVEASLARAFADEEPLKKRSGDINTIDRDMMGIVPPHFYRELARTSEGCILLREKGHFNDFAWYIREHGQEEEDAEIVTKVKGCLWAVGNIGSMPFGAPFLEEANIVESIVKIAEESQVLTLKGTAFFVLGLISRTMQGLEILLEYGWDGTTSTMGESLGFCIPLKLGRLLSVSSVAPWYHTGDETNQINRPSPLSSVIGDDPLDAKILTAIANLNNHILESGSTKELNRLKVSHVTQFQSPDLFRRVMTLLESFRYRQYVRRYILDLFEKSVVERVFAEGRADSEVESSDASEEVRQ
ncbi:hypothetical protein L873DRAFT_1689620 [Choiromyces venosus 120613-1]|uniref:REM-1 domain-containing protein n=1 Tax=Choiromyces venosus 120613-1 TaxID=1336337 RepID=A0A3N4JN47_9PEZI|nr:hypothetical protein L873DRAFT_1689620 [Choiromyces venosus 120613-1]